jgi:hypothetical protein
MIKTESYENKMLHEPKHGKLVIRNKTDVNLHGLKPDATMEIKTLRGMPVDRVWRNRLRDASIDNCIEVVSPTKPKGVK